MQTWQCKNSDVAIHFNPDLSGNVIFQAKANAISIPGDELIALIILEYVIPNLQKKFGRDDESAPVC
jgi:hypothetical protein